MSSYSQEENDMQLKKLNCIVHRNSSRLSSGGVSAVEPSKPAKKRTFPSVKEEPTARTKASKPSESELEKLPLNRQRKSLRNKSANPSG